MAGLEVVTKSGFSLNGNDSSDVSSGHVRCCLHDFVQVLGHHFMLCLKWCFANLGQYPSYITLKDNDNDKQNGTEKSSEKKIQGEKVKFARNKINYGDDNDAKKHLNCSGSTNEKDNTINNDSDNQYVYDILPSEWAKEIYHGIRCREYPVYLFYIIYFKNSTLKQNWTGEIIEIPKKDQVEYINSFFVYYLDVWNMFIDIQSVQYSYYGR